VHRSERQDAGQRGGAEKTHWHDGLFREAAQGI
jgi:hypothetical protein